MRKPHVKALSKHRSRGLHIAVACMLALALVSILPTQRSRAVVTTYVLTDLGPTVGVTSKAFGINKCGNIVGEYANAPAFWTNGTLVRTDLGSFGSGTGRAYALNASNFVAGSSFLGNGSQRAFIWHDNNNNGTSDAGELINLGTLNGGNTSDVYDINDLGEVVGASETDPDSLSQSAIIWDQSLGMRILNPANGVTPFSARGINNSSEIAGIGRLTSGAFHAFFFNGSLLDLGALGGNASFGYATEEVNGIDHVVGYVVLPPSYHAFVWNGTMLDIGTLGGSNSIAYGINAYGQVVGAADVPGNNSHAFIWQNGTMSDLNDLDDKPSNWVVQEAQSINKAGQIVGFGINPSDPTRPHAFLLTPTPLNSPIELCSLAPTTVSAVSGSGVFNSTATLTATLKSLNGAVSGKSVVFTVNSVNVGSATTANGIATLPGVSLSGINAGNYPTAIGASFVADSIYDASTAAGPLTVSKAAATITLDPGSLSQTYGGNVKSATATTNPPGLSGVTFNYSQNMTPVASPTNAGNYDVVASLLNQNYQAPNALGTLVINPASSTTTVTAANATYDAVPHGATATVTGAGGLNQSVSPITYTGRNTTVYNSTIAPTNAGDYTAAATFAGDSNHTGSSGSADFSITKTNQTITFGSLSNKTFGDADFGLTATATSNLTVSFAASGPCTVNVSTVHITGAGTGANGCTITASQAGDSNYNAATSVPRSFDIGKATATVTLSNLSQPYDGTAKSVTASTTPPGLNVVITYTQNGQPVTPVNLGSYDVSATINDTNYQGSASGTLVIHTPAPILILEEGSATRLAAIDSVTWVRGPFRILTERNFSADQHTRIIFVTSNLGLTQPNSSLLTVQAGGIPLTVEAVGPLTAIPGFNASYVVVRLADGLPTGDILLTVTLQGVTSSGAVITIAP